MHVGWVWGKGGEIVELDFGGVEEGKGVGVVFLQWRREGGSVEVRAFLLSFMRCI